MDGKILQYIYDHSTPEDPLLEDLYRQTHLKFVNPNMSAGHLLGRTLEMISKMIRPSFILEIGTFTGYSTICLARGLAPGGNLYTVELNDEITSFSRCYFIRAGLADKIIQMTGRAQQIVPDINLMFDLVFIDGDKREYSEYFDVVRDKVTMGGFILADNVLWGGKVLQNDSTDAQTRGIIEFNSRIREEPGFENYILPVRDGLMVIRKKPCH